LHDTPQKWAFFSSNRHVSHGCVRLEKPFDLAEFIMTLTQHNKYDDVLMAAGMSPKHDRRKIKKWIDDKPNRDTLTVKIKQNQRFNLNINLPVYLVYFTAVSNENGTLSYFRDAYRRDNKLMAVMKKSYNQRQAKSKHKNG
jgi:murein L,D-transpeptidase YcbB/YkuD